MSPNDFTLFWYYLITGEGNDTCETGESAGERTGEDAVLKEREATLGNCLSARDGWTTMSPCHRPSVLGDDDDDDMMMVLVVVVVVVVVVVMIQWRG